MNVSIVDWFGYPLPPKDRMRAIKEAGFYGVLLLWADYFDSDYKRFPDYARGAGLYIENAHAPYIDANALWEDTLRGEGVYQALIGCLKDCADHGIPALVMHPENKSGTKTVELSGDFTVGIDRMKRIVDVAERVNVNIAVENISRPEYLDHIFRSIQASRLGFCFDSGHSHVFTPKMDFLSLYGDKLMALHLHDNNGIEDWHALPFAGTIDWNDISAKLKQTAYSTTNCGSIALEVGNTRFEHIDTTQKFLEIAFARATELMGC